MTNDQIQSLDKCRDLNKILHLVNEEVNKSMNRLFTGANSNKGKELSVLVSELKIEIQNSIIKCEKGIDKIISEI